MAVCIQAPAAKYKKYVWMPRKYERVAPSQAYACYKHECHSCHQGIGFSGLVQAYLNLLVNSAEENMIR